MSVSLKNITLYFIQKRELDLWLNLLLPYIVQNMILQKLSDINHQA